MNVCVYCISKYDIARVRYRSSLQNPTSLTSVQRDNTRTPNIGCSFLTKIDCAARGPNRGMRTESRLRYSRPRAARDTSRGLSLSRQVDRGNAIIVVVQALESRHNET